MKDIAVENEAVCFWLVIVQ